MRLRYPQHLENVKIKKCSGCNTLAPIIGYWGESQEIHLCMICDNKAWGKLLEATGRIETFVKIY